MSYKIKFAIVKKDEDLINKLKENNFKFEISHDFLVISVKSKLKSKLKSYGVKEVVLIRELNYTHNTSFANYINFTTGEIITTDGINSLLNKIGVKPENGFDEYDYIFNEIDKKNKLLEKIKKFFKLR